MPIITDVAALKDAEHQEGVYVFGTTLEARLRALDPADTFVIADFDLTLANKSNTDFHKVSLSSDQRQTIRDTAGAIAGFIVLTARGETSTLKGIFGDCAAPYSITLASNCGHHVLVDTMQPEGERLSFSLADAAAQEKLPTIMQSINSVLLDVGVQYGLPRDMTIEKIAGNDFELPINGHGLLTIDSRERCGAIVFQNLTEDEQAQLRMHAKAAKKKLGGLADDFFEVSKIVDGVKGYFDYKPEGMSKGLTAPLILEHLHGHKINENSTFIVAGDSKPDLEMMDSLTRRYGKDRVICIWVGDDLKCVSDHLEKSDMDIHHLAGDQWTAVPQMYTMLNAIAAQPSANDARQRMPMRTSVDGNRAPRPSAMGS